MNVALAREEESDFDAVVIGAGLGGLSTALHLRRAGLRVAVVERAGRVGGLCGSHWIDGREYVIACNDFGTAMPRWLRDAGVALPFGRYRTRIHHRGLRFSLPPDVRSIARLLPHALDLLRYSRSMKAAKTDGYARYPSLGALVDGEVRDPMMSDLLKLPAYLMGVSPDRLRVDAMNDEFEFGYGYVQPTTPDDGPQALVDAMAGKIREHGEIRLNTAYLDAESLADGRKRVRTDRGDLFCRHLVEAHGDESAYPERFPRGLPLSMYCMTVSADFVYPKGVHTCAHYPPGISSWFSALEAGHLPEEFGFHVFKSRLPSAPPDEYAVNLYFYLPRGQETPEPAVLERAQRYLFSRLEDMLPGIGAAIRVRHFISADGFRARHGLSSRVLPVVTPAGFAKPANYRPQSDVYRAGAMFYPPGDHGSAAMLSGRVVADMIARAQIATAAAPVPTASLFPTVSDA
jgi:phytoene dehydrogenase-like protein